MASANLRVIETPALIVGAGPAGASLTCFLSHPPYSVTGIIISSAPTATQTPRAHITNAATLECLRDIGLEETCLATAFTDNYMAHVRWCRDMSGVEYARIYSFGHDPELRGEYETQSPCHYIDLPQTTLEPILTSRAAAQGWNVRYKTTLLDLKMEQNQNYALCRVRDEITQEEIFIRAKYVFGADGARSQVVREMQIPLIRKSTHGASYNIQVRCDLSDYMVARKGNLHWISQPEKDYPDHFWAAVVRVVKPWDEWLISFFSKPGVELGEPSREEWIQRCKEVIGKDVPLELIDISRWRINDTVAEYYSRGNVFCLGDAVHRHPPSNALGSNTCVQDAYNLAWKVKYIMHGLASPSLLETYSLERQPVGVTIVERANEGFRDHLLIMEQLGFMKDTPKERAEALRSLEEASLEASRKREKLMELVKMITRSYNALGTEMNQRYESSAVYLDDEAKFQRSPPQWQGNTIIHHSPSTYPGHRLPHAWLNKPIPLKKPVSTLDLAGNGRFCLFTGIGGTGWIEAAGKISTELGLEVKVHTIGWNQEWVDIYRIWERYREVGEDGCILARPDRVICWRSFSLLPDCEGKLREVLSRVLGK